MIGDRAYMRTPSFQPQRSAAVVLVVINVLVFVIQYVLAFYQPWLADGILDWFALSPRAFPRGAVWQIITFQFLHSGWMHLLCNMLVIYFFGKALEDTLGSRAMLNLYFVSGILGGLLQMAFAWTLPNYFGGSVVGASAGAFGLVAAFAMMFPEREITLLLFFVLPVSIRARTLLWLESGLVVLGIFVPSKIADAAHLGGILTGLAYVHWIVRGAGWRFSWPAFRSTRERPRELVRAGVPKRAFWQRSKIVENDDLSATEFISQEVDPILDKISAHGIQSLTDRERKILEAARAKMAKR